MWIAWPLDLRVDLTSKLQSTLVGSVSTIVLLHRMTDQTKTACFTSINHPGRKDQLLSHGNTNHPREALCTTCTGEVLNIIGPWPDNDLSIPRQCIDSYKVRSEMCTTYWDYWVYKICWYVTKLALLTWVEHHGPLCWSHIPIVRLSYVQYLD